MGQRCQIYIRYEDENKLYLLARWYQFNSDLSLISHARWGMQWIAEHFREKQVIGTVFDTNSDKDDVQIRLDMIAEYNLLSRRIDDFNKFIFSEDNKIDGKLLIDVDFKRNKIKYAFLDNGNNINNIMNAAQYMIWDMKDPLWDEHRKAWYAEEDMKAYRDNILQIEQLASIMTKEEVKQYLSADYSHQVIKKSNLKKSNHQMERE